eukprot:4028454-Prymnesium_polylepis.1
MHRDARPDDFARRGYETISVLRDGAPIPRIGPTLDQQTPTRRSAHTQSLYRSGYELGMKHRAAAGVAS